MEISLRLYGLLPKFRSMAEEDIKDWLRLYERYSKLLAWTEAQKADKLIVVLEDGTAMVRSNTAGIAAC